MPHLRMRLFAGATGTDRDVSWTHTSDLPEPWRWLTGGELLLTNGMSFPADGPGQRDLIEQLVEAGASALAVGEQMYCPELTDELVSASEELGLSVLLVEYPTPFVAISRAVAAANLLEESNRLVRTERIYRTVQHLVVGETDRSVLTEPLAQLLNCEVHVCDWESGEPWYPCAPRFDEVLHAAVQELASGVATLRAGALVQTLDDGREMRAVGIPTMPAARMVLVSSRPGAIDAILMQHAVTVIALELSQSVVALENQRRLGAELLVHAMDGRVSARSGRSQLDRLGVDVARARLLSVIGGENPRLRYTHMSLWRNGIHNASIYRSGALHLLVDDPDGAVDILRADLGHGVAIGVSAPVRSTDRVPGAMRESNWSMRIAADEPTKYFTYGDPTPFSGLGDIDQATALVDRVLSPLLDYEQQQSTPLLQTLEAYLDNHRSWVTTAESLQVHRQTVRYRIHKIEVLTGLDIDDTGHLAQLWLAVQAHRLLASDRD